MSQFDVTIIGSGPGVEYDKNAPMSMQTTSGFIKICWPCCL